MEFQHVGVAVADVEAAIEFYRDSIGMSLEKGPVEDPVHGVTVCLLGDSRECGRIELVAPLGPSSPAKGILERNGSAYHTCFSTRDIEQGIESIKRGGGILVAAPKPALLFDGRPVAWLFAPTRHLIELVQAQSD